MVWDQIAREIGVSRGREVRDKSIFIKKMFRLKYHVQRCHTSTVNGSFVHLEFPLKGRV